MLKISLIFHMCNRFLLCVASKGFRDGYDCVLASWITPLALRSLRFRRFCFLQPVQVAENSRKLAASATGTRALMRVPSLLCSVC